MVKLVLRISPVAKAALVIALVGCGLALYGKAQGVAWANAVGSAMLFGGAIVYLVERMRAITRRRRDDHDAS